MCEIRDRSVVRSSVIPSAKYCCSGSLLILAKGSTTIDRRGATAGLIADEAVWSLSEAVPTTSGGVGEDFVAGQNHQAMTAMTSAVAAVAAVVAGTTRRRRDARAGALAAGSSATASGRNAKTRTDRNYILDTLLAPVLERVWELVSDLVSDHSRNTDAPWFG